MSWALTLASSLSFGYEFEFIASKDEYWDYSEEEDFVGSNEEKGFVKEMSEHGY